MTQPGTTYAYRAGMLALLFTVSTFSLGTLSLSTCVVRNPHFEPCPAPPNSPPSICQACSTARFANDRVIVLRTDLLTTPRQIPFSVEVRDWDVNQMLTYKVFVDFSLADGRFGPFITEQLPPLPSTGDVDGGRTDRSVRMLNFTLPSSDLHPRNDSPNCHRVDLFVSSQFASGIRDQRLTQDRFDVASATWWVAAQRGDGTPVNMLDCPNLQAQP